MRAPDREPVAPGTSLLAFARLWFSPSVVAGVFEPLVADWQGEAQAAPTCNSARWINLRWRLAFLASGLMAFPRLVATPLPSGLFGDLALRAFVFGGLGFVMQQASGRGPEIVGAVVIDSLPFALLPVVLRLRRYTNVPDHATRSLTLLGATAVAVVLAMLAGPSWPTRAAAAAIPLYVAFMGWRLGETRPWWTDYGPLLRWWLTMGMVWSIWVVPTYPLKYALGIPLLSGTVVNDVKYLLALLLATLIQADDWREQRWQQR